MSKTVNLTSKQKNPIFFTSLDDYSFLVPVLYLSNLCNFQHYFATPTNSAATLSVIASVPSRQVTLGQITMMGDSSKMED